MTAHDIIQEFQHRRMPEDIAIAELLRLGVRGSFQDDVWPRRFVGHNKEGKLIESSYGTTVVEE